MHCLSTVRYSFLVNGALEGLSALIADSVAKKQWQGLKVCDGAPEISHLLFADDSMLYASATQHNCEVIREILNLYEDASGQQVNLEKSSVVFSGNVASTARQSLASNLGMQVVDKHGWRSKLLSAAGKEILIKVVAQAMPLHTVNNYLLPQHLIQELHQLCASFWWGGTEDKKAMLAKQGWRLIQNPNSLLGRLLKAIYFPTVNFWEAELGSSPSYAWRSILDGRDILPQGIKRRIGDGRRTNIWYDPWLEGENLLPYHSSRVHVVAIWRNRNDQVWNDDAESAEQLIPSTLAWWEEFKKANLPLKSPQSAPHLKWQPPPLGYIKLNVDAAFNIGDGCAGIGGIFRDHEGMCLVDALHTGILRDSNLREGLRTASAASLSFFR
ncbi:hypothetical protein ACLB2K_077368 [Fragaria x ananassa]